jgi:hypothetical protein
MLPTWANPLRNRFSLTTNCTFFNLQVLGEGEGGGGSGPPSPPTCASLGEPDQSSNAFRLASQDRVMKGDLSAASIWEGVDLFLRLHFR